jgi:hypothetical protein
MTKSKGFFNTRIRKQPYTPILFVMFTLSLWYVFQLMSRIVITCLPGGDACLLGWAPWPLHWLVWPIAQPSTYLYGSPPLDAFVSLVTLLLALWPGIRIFFPPEQL